MGLLDLITIHWSAGPYMPTATDREHYHYLVDGLGKVHEGIHTPESNIPPLKRGKYAAHCGGGNSRNIGVSMLGMAGFRNAKAVGKYPLTRVQCESAFRLVAELCKKHQIRIDPAHVFTHYEFGRRNPATTSAGKIDIVYLPPFPTIKQEDVGDFIRGKVRWHQDKL